MKKILWILNLLIGIFCCFYLKNIFELIFIIFFMMFISSMYLQVKSYPFANIKQEDYIYIDVEIIKIKSLYPIKKNDKRISCFQYMATKILLYINIFGYLLFAIMLILKYYHPSMVKYFGITCLIVDIISLLFMVWSPFIYLKKYK